MGSCWRPVLVLSVCALFPAATRSRAAGKEAGVRVALAEVKLVGRRGWRGGCERLIPGHKREWWPRRPPLRAPRQLLPRRFPLAAVREAPGLPRET